MEEKLQIKGLISVSGSHSFTCCDSRPSVSVGEIGLWGWLKEKSGCESIASEDDPNQNNPSVEWKIRYVVRADAFKDSETFEDAAAGAQIASTLSSSEIHGCYSEWTCGSGDYDFVLSGDHSILSELAGSEGLHVWIEFN